MSLHKNHLLKVLTVGLLCLTVYSVLLFGARQLPRLFFAAFIWPRVFNDYPVHISTASLLGDYEADPNLIAKPSYVSASIDEDLFSSGFGITDNTDMPEYVYNYDDILYRGIYGTIYFDKGMGLFIYGKIYHRAQDNDNKWTRQIFAYAGPEGIASAPDKKIGHFHRPLAVVHRSDPNQSPVMIVYDKKQSCFLRLDFTETTVTKGPKLPRDTEYQPCQLGMIDPGNNFLRISWSPPHIYKLVDRIANSSDQLGLNIPFPSPPPREILPENEKVRVDIKIPAKLYLFNHNFLPVLDAGGYIYKLDAETLKITDTLGFLPNPYSDSEHSEQIAPCQLLDYEVKPFIIEGQYRALFTAALSREGSSLALAAFDENGKNVSFEVTNFEDISVEYAAGPLFMVTRYLLENLQPPLFNAASYFTATHTDPLVGQRSLCFPTNSYTTRLAETEEEFPLANLLWILLIISPSLLLSLYLARRIVKDVNVVGLNRQVRKYWLIATVALGLPAYFTYRLTRPDITLVTCENCGRLRRPDFETCHHCKSKWHLPELAVPAWRVIDGQ